MLPDTALAMVDELTIGPVFPTGRAQREIDPGEFWLKKRTSPGAAIVF